VLSRAKGGSEPASTGPSRPCSHLDQGLTSCGRRLGFGTQFRSAVGPFNGIKGRRGGVATAAVRAALRPLMNPAPMFLALWPGRSWFQIHVTPHGVYVTQTQQMCGVLCVSHSLLLSSTPHVMALWPAACRQVPGSNPGVLRGIVRVTLFSGLCPVCQSLFECVCPTAVIHSPHDGSVATNAIQESPVQIRVSSHGVFHRETHKS